MKALKWICNENNIDVVILPNETRVSENLRDEKIRKNWIELNAEISKNATESILFEEYLKVFLNKFEDEEKKKIEKLKETH